MNATQKLVLARAIEAILKGVEPSDRIDVLMALSFCTECGYDFPADGRCYCTHDE